jgi:hypothetical protein
MIVCVIAVVKLEHEMVCWCGLRVNQNVFLGVLVNLFVYFIHLFVSLWL